MAEIGNVSAILITTEVSEKINKIKNRLEMANKTLEFYNNFNKTTNELQKEAEKYSTRINNQANDKTAEMTL